MRLAFLAHTSERGTGPGEPFVHLLRRLSFKKDLNLLTLLPSNGSLNKCLQESHISTRVLSIPPPWYMYAELDSESMTNHVALAYQVGKEIAILLKEFGAEILIINTHTSLAGLIAASQLNLPYVVWLHGVIDSINIRFPSAHFKWTCDELLIRCATSLISPSKWLSSVIKNQYDRDVSIIPNFTHVPDTTKPMPKGIFTFCCLSSWEPHKQIEIILEAAKILLERKRKFKINLYGSGPEDYVAGLRNRIQSWGLSDTVQLIGRVHNPRQVLHRSHALLSSSRIESFGMTLIEAMAEGRPVIASATTGHFEIVREGETGFLCPVNNSMVFAERMDWMIRHPQKVYEMGQRGWKISQSMYSGETSAQLFLDLLRNITNKERKEKPEALHHRYWPCRWLTSFSSPKGVTAPQSTPGTERPIETLSIPHEKTFLEENLVIGPDLKQTPTRYLLKSSNDSLSGLKCQISTHQTTAIGNVQFNIYDIKTGSLVRSVELKERFSDNTFILIEFEPILNSKDRFLYIDVLADLKQGRIAIYESNLVNQSNLFGKLWEKYFKKCYRKNSAFTPIYIKKIR